MLTLGFQFKGLLSIASERVFINNTKELVEVLVYCSNIAGMFSFSHSTFCKIKQGHSMLLLFKIV